MALFCRSELLVRVRTGGEAANQRNWRRPTGRRCHDSNPPRTLREVPRNSLPPADWSASGVRQYAAPIKAGGIMLHALVPRSSARCPRVHSAKPATTRWRFGRNSLAS